MSATKCHFVFPKKKICIFLPIERIYIYELSMNCKYMYIKSIFKTPSNNYEYNL